MPYYLIIGGQQTGPFGKEDLIAQGLGHDTLVWREGSPHWVPASQFTELKDLLARVPPPLPRHLRAGPAETRHSPALDFAEDGDGYRRMRPPRPIVRVRYAPNSFRTLYGWWVTLLALAHLPVVAGVVFFIVAVSQDTRPVSGTRYDSYSGRTYHTYQANSAAQQRQQICLLLAAASYGLFFLILIPYLVICCVLFYRLWNQIQDGWAPTSAGAATGLLFVPFFNLYWCFVAIYGLADALNRYARRHRIALKPVPGWPALVWCIMVPFWCIPYLGILTGIVHIICMVIAMNMFKNAAVVIAEAKLAAKEEARPRLV